MIDKFNELGIFVGSVVITQYAGQPAADAFRNQLDKNGIDSYLHYPIKGYPTDMNHIISPEGMGKNDYIKTSRNLIVVTAPGPGSGKLATCMSNMYHDQLNGIKSGYAKFETFPVWNLPLHHPVNLAYEAATADLDDVNMIDPFHLQTYGETTVNYNRDIEIFPVLKRMLERILGEFHTLHQQTWVSTWLASLLQIMRLLSKLQNKKSFAVTIRLFLILKLKSRRNCCQED